MEINGLVLLRLPEGASFLASGDIVDSWTNHHRPLSPLVEAGATEQLLDMKNLHPKDNFVLLKVIACVEKVEKPTYQVVTK
jgi:hypothetical protein